MTEPEYADVPYDPFPGESGFTVIRYRWQTVMIASISSLALAFTFGYFFGIWTAS